MDVCCIFILTNATFSITTIEPLEIEFFFGLVIAYPVHLTKRHHMCVILKCTVSTLLNISCYTPRMMSNEPENVKKANPVCLYETIFHHSFWADNVSKSNCTRLLFSLEDAWCRRLMIEYASNRIICILSNLQSKLLYINITFSNIYSK